MATIQVRFSKGPSRDYKIEIKPGLINELPSYLKKHKFADRYVIITDSKVAKLYGESLQKSLTSAGIKSFMLTFPEGEKQKTLSTAEKLINKMLKLQISRSDAIIALGGGVVGDLAGFVASTYMRGIRVIQAPTTLLAMVDASIGGKTGVNVDAGKNLLGTFYQPEAVLIDTNMLKTLSSDEWENGFAEIIKYSIITKSSLFHLLNGHSLAELKSLKLILNKIIIQCCKIKASIISKDETENNQRMVLNYGHTVGHALEKHFNYSISHGKAVAIGMKFINYIAVNKDQLKQNDQIRIQKLINRYVNTSTFEQKIHIKKVYEKLWHYMQNDKKVRESKIYFIVPKSIGQVDIQNTITKQNFLDVLPSFTNE